MAVDYQSQNIYYTDPEVGIVLVQVGVTQPRFNVLLRDLDDPHDIFVDPDSGYVVIVDIGAFCKVKSSFVSYTHTHTHTSLYTNTIAALAYT